MVLIPDAMVRTLHGFDGKLPIVGWNGKQFAPGKFFRSATFVGIDVRGLGADHGMIGIRQRFQAEAIGSGAVEHDEDVNVGAKMLLKFAYCGFGVGVISVSNRMTLVGGEDSRYDFRMDARVVVAGNAANRLPGGHYVREGVRSVGHGSDSRMVAVLPGVRLCIAIFG